jgi:hypothetical protein
LVELLSAVSLRAKAEKAAREVQERLERLKNLGLPSPAGPAARPAAPSLCFGTEPYVLCLKVKINQVIATSSMR